MISVITCSRTNQVDLKFQQNIYETIGADFELIVIDNSEKKYTIFEAYNKAIKESNGDVLCFIHDDILFHTQNWGKILELEFKENPNFDLIGVAGTKVKTHYPTGWWDCDNEYKVINIIQHENQKIQKQCLGFTNNNLQEVLVIDGVFMALKKKNNFLFDTSLKGFHNYDLNLSYIVRENQKKVGVTKKILIEHFSIGKLNSDWFFSTILFHKKYLNNLRNNNLTYEQEVFSGKKYIDHCLFILGKRKGLKYLFSIFQYSTSTKINFVLVKYILNRFFLR